MAQRSLEDQLDEIFSKYPDKVDAMIQEESKTIAQETVARLKATSPRRKGKYARSWKCKINPNTRNGYIVYNDVYRLTHLLENGHDIRNQFGSYDQRVPGKKHIKPAEEAGILKYDIRLRIRISRGLT